MLSCAAHGKEATDRDPCKGVLSEKEQHVFVEPSGLTEEEEEEYDDGDDGGEAGC